MGRDMAEMANKSMATLNAFMQDAKLIQVFEE
jgi:hypothetical protein